MINPSRGHCLVLYAALVPAAAAQAQDASAPARGEGQLVIDILSPLPAPSTDAISEDRCEEEVDAGRITGEIVVCGSLDQSTDGAWDKKDFERRYAEATSLAPAPNVDGTGLPIGLVPIVTIPGCFAPPCPTKPALLIDIEALPQSSKGSDADLVSRGLTPRDDEEKISDAARKRLEQELGLPKTLDN